MGYGMLADAVVVVHAAFVGFAVLGGLLAARWPRLALLQIPAAAWGILVEVAGWPCPLTPLENALRAHAGDTGYGESFIEHHLLPILYPEGLTRTVQLGLAACVLTANALAYGYVLRQHARRVAR
jgi:hypothetical protein